MALRWVSRRIFRSTAITRENRCFRTKARYSLKDGLQPELNLPGGTGGSKDHAGRRADRGSGKDIEAGRQTEVRAVQCVEGLCPEFQTDSLPDGCGLKERHIEIAEAWSNQPVLSDVAECTGSFQTKGVWIKPLDGCAFDDRSAKSGVPVRTVRIRSISVPGTVAAG